MTTQIIEGACTFAWRNYMLLHSGISEDDDRRAALFCYICSLDETAEYDFGLASSGCHLLEASRPIA